MSLLLRYRKPEGGWASLNLTSMGDEGATLGRNAEHANVVIKDRRLSRRQCRFQRQGLFYSVEDCDSANGTWVNGVRIDEPTILKVGDAITLGDSELTVDVAKVGGDDPYVGRNLNGFEIQRLIGVGQTAQVYQGLQVNLGRQVAVKILGDSADEQTREAFLNQARSAGAFNHPQLVQVHDVCDDKEATFFVMELMEGGSAGQRLADTGVFDEMSILMVLEYIGEALSYAERQGVVHRDLKPSNILFAADGSVKLGDLGIAAQVAGTKRRSANEVVGNIYYLAPEQIRGGAIGPGSDLYALGATCWHLLAGRPLFDGSKREIATAHLNTPPPDLMAQAPHLDRRTVELVQRLLAKKPEERPKGGKALAQEARRLAELVAAPAYGGARSSVVSSRSMTSGVGSGAGSGTRRRRLRGRAGSRRLRRR